MGTITRRAVLKAAPAVAVAAALPVAALAAEPESEILRLYRLSLHHFELGYAVPFEGKDFEEAERLANYHYDLAMEAEDAMLLYPARTVEELAAKVLAHTARGESWLTNSDGGLVVLAELNALVGAEVPAERD